MLWLAGVTAVNAGLPQFPVVIIDHPIWTRDEAWIEAAAAPLAAALAAKLFEDSPA